ncbi:MAG TPA: hypothetical protein V6D12_06680 [Candidatus Obscuribacterales bacterium]
MQNIWGVNQSWLAFLLMPPISGSDFSGTGRDRPSPCGPWSVPYHLTRHEPER